MNCPRVNCIPCIEYYICKSKFENMCFCKFDFFAASIRTSVWCTHLYVENLQARHCDISQELCICPQHQNIVLGEGKYVFHLLSINYAPLVKYLSFLVWHNIIIYCNFIQNRIQNLVACIFSCNTFLIWSENICILCYALMCQMNYGLQVLGTGWMY